MINETIAEHFRRLADLMEINGDDHFRIRSYRNAAETISDWPIPLSSVREHDGLSGLQKLPGVGQAISKKIIELLDKGTFDAWEKLILKIPLSVLDLLSVDGITTGTAAILFRKFKISTLADLREFVSGAGLELIDGVGPDTVKRINSALSRIVD